MILIIHIIIFLWPEYVIAFLCERLIPCHSSTSVLCLLSPRDSTLQYKGCVHLWNNILCIITLVQRIFSFTWTCRLCEAKQDGTLNYLLPVIVMCNHRSGRCWVDVSGHLTSVYVPQRLFQIARVSHRNSFARLRACKIHLRWKPFK